MSRLVILAESAFEKLCGKKQPNSGENPAPVTAVGVVTKRKSSAIAEGPRDALCQLKSCQLLHNCTNKLHSYR